MIGQTVSHYRVLERLGGGGMGVVYLAEDTTLGRKVALKFLTKNVAPTDAARARLVREARAASALNHPHICVVHEVGEHDGQPFIAMEWLEGETLKSRCDRGPLPVDLILELAEQIADALDTAHASGIIHRDLKPANLFLTARGDAKVLDFGLAMVADFSDHGDTTTPPPDPLTEPGTVVGTLAYMAPEQARGEHVDARSDLFSLGAVLYELATGRAAFAGRTPAVTYDALLNRRLPSVREVNRDVPAPFDLIISKLLAKDPASRPRSARILRDEVHAIRRALGDHGQHPGSASPRPSSIAVLPFANLSADPDNEYFSDGLSDELLNALTRLPGLRVAARTSSFQFRGRNTDIHEIGRQLNVDHVLDGSVRRSANRLRVTAQLSNVADGYHLWSERYDREMADVFQIQDDITAAIVKTLEPTLLGTQQPAVLRHSYNVEAFERYLMGRHHWHHRTPQSLRTGLAYFEEAIRLDPGYALAYAGLADSYALLITYGYLSPEQGLSKALDAAAHAMALDPKLAESHFAMALCTFWLGADWPEAEPHFLRALQIQPRSSMAHVYYALFLATRHRFADAAAQTLEAVALDSLSPFVHGIGALAMHVARRYDEALRLAERSLELHPDFALGLWTLGLICCRVGQFERANAVLQRVMLLSNRAHMFVGLVGLNHGMAGRRAEAIGLAEELEARSSTEYVAPTSLLMIRVGLRDREKICDALQACVDRSNAGSIVEGLVGPFLDEWASDPRFAGLARTLRLVDRPPTP
jgi:serine/threonine protein kinase/tetratricopeptide (TPR) repeat protein